MKVTCLFSDNFADCDDNEKLLKLHADNLHLDPYYITSHVSPNRRKVFERCYKIYEPYKDRNFLTEIKTRFHQRTWEMYLGSLFINNGKVLNNNRKEHDADIQVKQGENLIHVECTATTLGEENKPDTVPEMYVSKSVYNLVVQDVPEEKILLRIAQALTDKHKQYQKRITDGRVKENEPYVVAINTGTLQHMENLPNILKTLFGIGHITLRMRQNGIPVENPTPYWSRRESITKANGEIVDMTFFEKEEHKSISAVIYSNSTVLNHLLNPSDEDTILVHNPLASNPIPFEEFNFLTQHYVDKETGIVEKITPKS